MLLDVVGTHDACRVLMVDCELCARARCRGQHLEDAAGLVVASVPVDLVVFGIFVLVPFENYLVSVGLRYPEACDMICFGLI